MKRLGSSLAVCVLGLGCSTSPNPNTVRDVPAPRASSPTSPPLSSRPEWFVLTASSWVEKDTGGIHRGLAGVRFEAQGRRVLRTADKPSNLDDARVAPPWALLEKAPCKYVFWHDDELFGAADWLGEARKVGPLPAPVQDSFEWFDGVGIATAQGMFVVHAATCALDKLSLPNAATAGATGPQRALFLTTFGHSHLTVDGGKTFRDLSAELPNAGAIDRLQEDLHVSTGNDELFVLNAQGQVKPGKRIEDHAPNEPEQDAEDRWPLDHDLTPALEAAVTNGLFLPNGEAITTDEGLVARVQLATGRATEVLRYGMPRESCLPVAVSDRALVVCEIGPRASVIDAGSGRVEKSFDIENEAVWDRFVADDNEALGFVGSCAGRNPGPPVDVVATASVTSTSTQRSPTFCVRTASGNWVEHHLDAADATDVLAWIPHRDGGATALIGLPGTFLHRTPAVEMRESLRIVRIARNAPPVDISTYGSESPKLLARALHSLADGSIEGWLTSGHSPTGQMALKIDAHGNAQQRPLPARASTLVNAGRFAVVRTEDDRFFESTDFGLSFQPIDPPPGRHEEPRNISSVGVQIGPFLRVGWGQATRPIDPSEKPPTEPSSTPTQRLPPAVRLGCRFSGPPDTGRISDAVSLGLSKNSNPQMSTGRIGLLGTFYTPWRTLPNLLSGNAEFVYVPLLDLAAPVRRASVPLSKLENEDRFSHEIRTGFVLDGPTVWPVAAERYLRCPAPLSDEAGVTVPLGACVEDPTTGVVLDGRAFLVHPWTTPYSTPKYARLIVSTANWVGDRSGKTKPRGASLKELATTYVPGGIQRYKFAAGSRGKTPVLVAMDSSGNATLAPIDPVRGTFGAEEPLVSLSKLQLGTDARCVESPDDARVLLQFTTELGLQTQNLPGVRDSEQGGVAILRWSKQRVCLDAIDMSITDERHEPEQMMHLAQGPIRKIVARFDKPNGGKGTLAVISYGLEVRQPIVCEGAAP